MSGLPADADIKRRPTKAFVIDVWYGLAERDRRIKTLNDKIGKLGFLPVVKGTLYRWLAEAKQSPPPRPVAVTVQPPVPVLTEGAAKFDTAGIPPELVEALGLRLLVVAKGAGLDRVEDAIIRAAAVISKKIGEGDVEQRRSDADALMVLADAMHRVTAGRLLITVGARNYAEGDRLAGEGSLFQAQAEAVRNSSRAEAAKEIDGRRDDGQPFDQEVEDEAVAALREIETRK